MWKINHYSWTFDVDRVENYAFFDNVFTPEECAKIIEIGNKRLIKGKTNSNSKDGLENAHRESRISWLSPSDDLDWAYMRITDIVHSLNERFFQFDIFGFTEGWQFTRYDAPTGRYGKHIDKNLGKGIRKLSLTIQLSSPNDYTGGDLCFTFSEDQEIMLKEQGKLIMFPSYVVHEVTPVTQGTRYSLVAWISGKPFK